MKHIEESVAFLKEKGFDKPEIGIILGTGLGGLIREIEIIHEISYNHIPNFPTVTVEFHKGRLVYGLLEGKKVVVMEGRFHHYEGYSLRDVTFPVRIMHQLGIEKLLVSNASGALNLDFELGEMMLITDHINLQGGSPLAFKGVSKHGKRFVDLRAPYDKEMSDRLCAIAEQQKVKLYQGVYVAVIGPELETRAEYRYLKTIGADAVGMSTVPEIIVANHLSLPVVAVSVLTDACDPDNLSEVTIDDIMRMANKAEPKMITLFKELIRTID